MRVLITYETERMPAPADNGIRASVQRPSGRSYFLAPVPALSMLEELPAFILPEEVPVVVPFFIFVCLALLLVAPGPTLPSLEAPGAG